MTLKKSIAGLATFALLGFAAIAPGNAAAIRTGFNTNSLTANDDGSTGQVSIGFNMDFFGSVYNSLFVNNNGNVTFNAALSTFTPFGLLSTSTPIIAPFFGDVDTRVAGSVTYGISAVDGRQAFGVNWDDVGYYNMGTNRLNDFQMVIVDRSDTGAGNFDLEFNYDQIQWETGNASGGSGGLGGNSARVGYSNGSTASFELAGSAINGAFLDSNTSTGLIYNSLNSDVLGRYRFFGRNGTLVEQDPAAVPEPASVMGVLVFAAMGAGSLRKRDREKTI